MAELSIHAGVNGAASLPDAAVVIVGQGEARQVAYEALAAKFAGRVSAETYAAARASNAHCVSLWLGKAFLCKLPTRASRHQHEGRPDALTKQLRSLPWHSDGAAVLSVVVRTPVAHALAYVAAAARAFPLYNRKTSGAAATAAHKVSIELVVDEGEHLSAADVSHLADVCDAVRRAAMLGDTPANELHTDAVVEHALAVARQCNAEVDVIRGADLESAGFGGLYNVGKASEHPPALVVLKWQPAEAKQTVALVGKGIVFDTGGLSLKGKTAMPSMKFDMCGAAAVLHAFAALVRAGFTERLHALLCVAENSAGPKSMRPDDIIRMLSGKTVEVNNTDAEGRLVLGDGVFYAKSVLKADVIIDLATLTGAQVTATGAQHAAIVCNNERWERAAVDAGRHAGDLCHPMVYVPDVAMADLKSSVADMRNSNMGKTRAPNSVVAATFIQAQLGIDAPEPWLHVDMAAPAKCRDTDRATGYGVAMLVSLLGRHTKAANLCYGMGQHHW